MFLIYILVAILALMFMITIHELGHYIAAKILKFRVAEFAIGFGKPIFKWQSKKTGEIFSIRMIPLGGYCAFESDENSVGDATQYQKNEFRSEESRAKTQVYDKQAPWKRLIVLFAGVFANFICGIVFCLILLMSIGYYHTVTITNIDADATHTIAAGLEVDDEILTINGEKMSFLKNYQSKIGKFSAGEEFEVVVKRNGQVQAPITLTKETFYSNEHQQTLKSALGINGHTDYTKMTLSDGLPKSFVFAFELAHLVLNALFKMVTFQMSLSDMGGTFSTIAVMSSAVSANMLNLLILIPLISINLAVFNLLPIPALDGARMVFVTIEWIRGKPVNPELENRIHMIGLLCLLAFVLLLDVNYLIFQKLF